MCLLSGVLAVPGPNVCGVTQELDEVSFAYSQSNFLYFSISTMLKVLYIFILLTTHIYTFLYLLVYTIFSLNISFFIKFYIYLFFN